MVLEDLFDQLEGMRIRVLYDSRRALVELLFGELLPILHRKKKRVNMVIHSEHALRKIEIASRHYEPSLFRDMGIIKIGLNTNIPFGKLKNFISIKDRNLFKKLTTVLNSLDAKRTVVYLVGLYTVFYFHRNPIRKILDLFENLSPNLTVIMPQPIGVLERCFDVLLSRLFDVDLTIRKSNEDYFNERYTVQIEQSILPSLNFFADMQILPDGRVEWFKRSY